MNGDGRRDMTCELRGVVEEKVMSFNRERREAGKKSLGKMVLAD